MKSRNQQQTQNFCRSLSRKRDCYLLTLRELNSFRALVHPSWRFVCLFVLLLSICRLRDLPTHSQSHNHPMSQVSMGLIDFSTILLTVLISIKWHHRMVITLTLLVLRKNKVALQRNLTHPDDQKWVSMALGRDLLQLAALSLGSASSWQFLSKTLVPKDLGLWQQREIIAAGAGVATESSCLYPQAGSRELQPMFVELFIEIDSSEIWGN